MEKIRKEISDLDAQLERGDFGSLLGWLRRNVHRHGRKFTPNELLERATGKPLTAAPWIAYVQNKFAALYGLHAGAH
jgi:carboxypeptidase Taq